MHSAHTGITGCLRRARETVFWPGISKDITDFINSCSICQQHSFNHQKEPLRPHPTPEKPWERIGVDIFHFYGVDYLMTVDYLSGFFEIDRLPSKRTSDIISCLRPHLARHGIPLILVSDCSPFNSSEFKRFSEKYDFQHITSSPRYPQSNGKVECAIKTAKRIMTKATEDNSDPFLALLEFRNTPSEQLKLSPTQILFGRRTRTLLPTADVLLKTHNSDAASVSLKRAKEKQAFYYDRGSKPRMPFHLGQTVRFKFDDSSDWRKGRIYNILPNRSYEIQTEDGSIRRRTSKHVRSTSEPPIIITDDDEDPATDFNPTSSSQPVSVSNSVSVSNPFHSAPPLITTRSGRIINRPARYRD